jgi:hypothetical protein
MTGNEQVSAISDERVGNGAPPGAPTRSRGRVLTTNTGSRWNTTTRRGVPEEASREQHERAQPKHVRTRFERRPVAHPPLLYMGYASK